MPAWARGALVTHVPADVGASVPVSWSRHGAKVPDGVVLLSWHSTSNGATDTSAQLGLANGEVTLALWPNLRGDWIRVVHPTLHEVLGLHAAMSLAKDALRLANHLLDAH
ncbi:MULTISPECIES: esterase [unclassified Streptomyces]|uniref:esterase n=1 Tax=unclassified Streptomyces TaxID=2593676 RepID=UPI002DD9A818|nr:MULTISPECIES: esterase [unclassified Streptomyces]WSA96677.1 esterase [Streptomyces sp. NBC_01795]WSB81092.1 esterase [Streptomyces sp. NBC_01775]WSS39393.1 esterase [Streptomyces sp. NBC_01187]